VSTDPLAEMMTKDLEPLELVIACWMVYESHRNLWKSIHDNIEMASHPNFSSLEAELAAKGANARSEYMQSLDQYLNRR
jgi:hypothetical protein